MRSGMPRWMRIVLVGGCLLLAAGLGLAAYRSTTRPVTLTLAAGSIDGDAARMMSAIASRLAETGSPVRLRIVDKGTALETARAFAAGEVDLAIVRGDLADASALRAVLIVGHAVVLLVVPPGGGIDSIEGLKGRTVGVLGGGVNHRLVEALSREYDLARARVQFRDLAVTEIQPALKARQLAALLVVMPVTEKYMSWLRGLFQRVGGKLKLGLIPIDAAEAIATVARTYESYDLPKGAVQGSPPIPDDDLTTLRIPLYLVAKPKLADERVIELAKSIMDMRRELVGEYPLLAQISAPSTDKDAYVPIHPGAAVYFGGDQKTFFDKYGDQLFYGTMLLGALSSLMAGAWRFLATGEKRGSPIEPLYALADRIRDARDQSELDAVEDEIDGILKGELARAAKGGSRAADTAALSLAAHRLEHLIDRRRSALPAPQPRA